MKEIIRVEELVHRYGAKTALNGMDFSVGEGEVFGLLGPNGAGKTTTIRLLNGLLRPQSGKMSVMGLNPLTQGTDIRRRAGVLTETPALYERLTAHENLRFFATLAGMQIDEMNSRINELLDFFDLMERANDRVGTYSKGMKQRLALARALLIRPELLFLDEPTSGLDPEAAKQVHELIADVRRRDGHTVVLCTHHLYEAERLCDHLAVMNNGRVIACGTLEELRQVAIPEHWIKFNFLESIEDSIRSSLERQAGVVECKKNGLLSLLVQVKDDSVVPALVNFLVGKGACILAVEPQFVSLEEIYFRLQQKQETIKQ